MLNVGWQSIQNWVCVCVFNWSLFFLWWECNQNKSLNRCYILYGHNKNRILSIPFHSYELFRKCHSHFKHQFKVICKYFHKEDNYMLVFVFAFAVRRSPFTVWLSNLDSSHFTMPFRFCFVPLKEKQCRNGSHFGSYLWIGMTWHRDDDDFCIVLAPRLENQIYLSRSNDEKARLTSACLTKKHRIGSKHEQRTQNDNRKKSGSRGVKRLLFQGAYNAKF